MKTTLLPAARILCVFTILTGLIYPVAITVLSQIIFPHQSNGSMITRDGIVVGSELIGQGFASEKYFHPRPSAIGYNPLPSSGTNRGPTDHRLADSVHARRQRFIRHNGLSGGMDVPKDMLFASSSGVDPHISPEAAMLQAQRVAASRKIQIDQLDKLIDENTEGPQFGIFGNRRVNVVMLNLALDELHKQSRLPR